MMLYERKQRRKAKRQKKELNRARRSKLEKAALDLLAVCKALVNYSHNNVSLFDIVSQAEAAIAKAENQS